MASRMAAVSTTLAVVVSIAVAGGMSSPANAAASVSIDDPGAPTAGTVTLTGKVGASSGGVTSVLYVIDASGSTAAWRGSDCSGNGLDGPEDDFNGDALIGDILDCEISGVLALNKSLPASGVQVGLVGLAGEAAAADLDPAGSAAFVARLHRRRPSPAHRERRQERPEVSHRPLRPSRLRQGHELQRGDQGRPRDARERARRTQVDDVPLRRRGARLRCSSRKLHQSGVRLRSFGIGASATCDRSASLYKLATATGESCEVVPNPASLAAALTGSQPEAVNGVTVTINDVSVAADLDALGGWRTNFTLGAGTYTATARGILASGVTVSTQRTFSVAPSAGGPPPGSVSVGEGAFKATAIKVDRPKPTRKALPATVSGRVGRYTSHFETTKRLKGARVILEAQRGAGAQWRAVDRGKADRAGHFVLRWRVKSSMTRLRVVLRPYRGSAGSVAAAPAAAISTCTVTKRGNGWTVKCNTTAKDGRRVRLLKNGTVTDVARVRDGAFSLRGTGSVRASTVDVTAGRRHIRLRL